MRGFLIGDDSMAASVIECLDDDLLVLLRARDKPSGGAGRCRFRCNCGGGGGGQLVKVVVGTKLEKVGVAAVYAGECVYSGGELRAS